MCFDRKEVTDFPSEAMAISSPSSSWSWSSSLHRFLFDSRVSLSEVGLSSIFEDEGRRRRVELRLLLGMEVWATSGSICDLEDWNCELDDAMFNQPSRNSGASI